MTKKRKHLVVLEVTLTKPGTEKNAIEAVREGLYYADYFNQWVTKCTVKSYRRVHCAALVNLLRTMPLATANLMREYI